MNFSARAHASSESPRKVTSLSRTTRLSSTFTPKHFGPFDERAHFVHGVRHEELVKVVNREGHNQDEAKKKR